MIKVVFGFKHLILIEKGDFFFFNLKKNHTPDSELIQSVSSLQIRSSFQIKNKKKQQKKIF